MKKFINSFLAIGLAIFLTLGWSGGLVHAFTSNNLVDDFVFDNTGTMNAAQIDAWLNNNFGSTSCISTSHLFSAPEPIGYSPSPSPGVFSYTGNVSAGTVIYDASHVYGVNPQVLLATLQKEQSLVTGGSGCTINGDTAAMGYGCPDGGTTHSYPAEGALAAPLFYYNNQPINSVSGTCVNTAAKAGFSQQVIHAAWLLAFGKQRSEGNVNWNVQLSNFPHAGNSWDNSDDPPTVYGGPMTQGNRATSSGGSATFYDGYTTIDGISTHMDTGATASLYWYTPHFSGNQNFVTLFTNWFGSPTSACEGTGNIGGAIGGGHIVSRNINGKGKPSNLSLVFLNNTGSACVEVHTWSDNTYQVWSQNLATNLRVVNPADDELISADIDGSGRQELMLIKLRGTDSGKIEVHTWDATNQHWYSNVATFYPAVDPAQYRVISADINGDGKDELILVKYNGTDSGKIEIFPFSSDLQSFTAFIATNHPTVSPSDAEVIGANTTTDGGPVAKLILVKYRNTASGRIEVHTWNPGEQSWYSNVATNHPAVDPADDEVIAADITGSGKKQLLLIKYRNSASGKIEIHAWGANEQTWYNNQATQMPTIAP